MPNTHLNHHQLEVFAAVVEYGTLTEAAARLYLTQPAVSVQLRRLQNVLGTPILRREGRRVVATEAGLIVYRYARELLAASDTLQREIDEMKSGEFNHLTIAAGPWYGAYVLPGLFAAFRRQYARVHLTQIGGSTPEIIERVRRNEIDIGIVHPVQARGELEGTYLGTDPLIIVESTERPFFGEPEISLAQVSTLPFVRLRSWPFSFRETRLEHVLSAAGLPPVREVATLSSCEGVLEMVRAGVAVAVVYRSSVQDEIARGSIRPLTIAGYSDVHNVYLIKAPRLLPNRSRALQDLTALISAKLSRILGTVAA